MAIDRRITDLDSIVALSTGDLFLVTDADQSNIAKNADIDIITSYVVARVPSSARAFGGGVNEIAQWAEGNNVDQIPAAKIPTNAGVDLSNYVTLDSTQVVTGIKNFTNLLSDSQEVVTIGNPQTITGIKTLASPTLTGLTSVNTIHFPDGSTQDTAFSGGGDLVTKATVDAAIGVSPTGDSAQFYNQQGNFVDAVYDSIEDAPIIRNRTIERIVLSGTRSNVVVNLPGVNEFSTITMDANFDPTPTQYTSVFNSPNTSFTPSPSVTTSDIGRQFSLTESDGTEHIFIYLTNGNFRYLADGITGTLRKGTDQVATTASTTGTFTIGDQAANQTVTLAGDQRSQFGVGDFITKSTLSGQAFRGMFIESVTINGSNTDLVGTGNGGTSFSTTDTLYVSAAPSEILGTIPTFSYDPDTANTVYTNAALSVPFTNAGVGIATHLQQIGAAIAALDTDITFDGVVTDNGNATSSITIDLGTETNINSSFTLTGGLNNTETLVNTDGASGGTTPSTTITVIDPEATEVVSFTASVSTTTDNNIADIANQIVSAVNTNVETPINFDAEYDSATNIIVLTAQEAGNTNFWTIVIDNNGATAANAGDLGYTSSQSGEIINQLDTTSIRGITNPTANFIYFFDEARPSFGESIVLGSPSIIAETNNFEIGSGFRIAEFTSSRITMNDADFDVDFRIKKSGIFTPNAYEYDAGTDVTTIDSDTINFVANTITGLPSGGADGLSITDTVNLNLLEGTTVLSTVVLPSSSGTTVIAGTANQIINTVSGDTNTLSLATAITGAITANTAKTGITTAQANAIIANTSKTGITTAQATAITNNTAKTGITTAQASAITANTAKTGITTAQATAITDNTAKNSYPTADSTKLAGIEALADVTDTTNVVSSLTAGTNITIAADGTISAAGGGTATTVLGTTGEIDVNTVGTNATVSLSSTITSAITANTNKTGITSAQATAITDNTAKQSVAGLTQVGGAIIASDSVLYYDGTVPRRKVFSSVPLSVMNNDSGFTTNTGTVTSVTGTANQINVANGTTTPVVSLNNTITSAITANTSKTGISTAQASAITANTAKVSNVDILPLDNTFTGVNTFEGNAFFTSSGGINTGRIAGSPIDIVVTSNYIVLSPTSTIFNQNNVDVDFRIRKQTTDNALSYDAGTDTLDIGAANVTGVAAAETGTWNPTFNNGGTEGTTNATYSRVGNTVVVQCEIVMASGATGDLTLVESSLPFQIDNNADQVAGGTYYTSTTVLGVTGPTTSGVITGSSSAIYFLNGSTPLNGDDIRGFLGFTITYRTT